MNYKFATENKNYEDYGSGRVLFNQQGTTSFPVRLTSEIFQRCKAILEQEDVNRPYTIYDPCCGGAYLLSTIGFLHGDSISKIYASDINENVVPLAEKNLSLLSIEGINERIEQIKTMIDEFGKESHYAALESALRVKGILEKRINTIETKCFISDATKDTGIVENVKDINIVITDLPYGDIVQWGGMNEGDNPIVQLLENILPKLAQNSVVAVVSKKKTTVKHDKYKKIKSFTIGKRQVVFLQPIG